MKIYSFTSNLLSINKKIIYKFQTRNKLEKNILKFRGLAKFATSK